MNNQLHVHFKKIKGYNTLTNIECKDVATFIKVYENKSKKNGTK